MAWRSKPCNVLDLFTKFGSNGSKVRSTFGTSGASPTTLGNGIGIVIESTGCSNNGLVDIGLTTTLNLGDDIAVVREDHIESLAIGTINKLAVDEEFLEGDGRKRR
jgi:hypothetical protein